MMKKMIGNLVVAAILASMILSGCGEETQSSQGTGTDNSAQESSTAAIENFNETGYPIVDETITLKGKVACGAFYGNFTDMSFFKAMEEKTNIHIEWEMVTQNAADVYSLMFASREYPDFICGGASDTNIQGAIDAGDVYQLDDLINSYAPNWKAFFEENDYALKCSVMGDGNLWGLPIVREEPSNVGIRDQWMICTQWLDELNLEMPKTTDDLYNVLKAFKDNAGTGTIPEDVIPWYMVYDAQANGGQFELYNAFGVFVPGYNKYFAVDENMKVINQAINPDLKEPIKYLNKLYSEGLIPPDAFTGAETFESIVTSKTPITGSYIKYFNHDETGEIYQPMPPLTSPQNDAPMWRRQVNGYSRNKFVMLKTINIRKLPSAIWIFLQNRIGRFRQCTECTVNGWIKRAIKLSRGPLSETKYTTACLEITFRSLLLRKLRI